VSFYISNGDTHENSQVMARLVYETTNVYFFAQEGADVKLSDVKQLVDEFQDKTYPTDRDFFGSEWTPGVDGDPHLYMLYAHGLGAHAQAYYDSTSELSRLAYPFSNEKEIFMLNADQGELNDPYWRPTLAHEFQHMIHWYHDRNAELWMDEGSSMLAEEINGFDVGGVDFSFLSNPDLQLNTWSDLSVNADTPAHYGGAYLFMKYFLDRFGKEATKALVSNPHQSSGVQAVTDTLASLNVTDPATGKTLTAVDVFADWTVANYLNDSTVGDGRYAYANYSNRVGQPTDSVTTCPQPSATAPVRQFGTDYIEIQCAGSVTINFTGSQQAQLVPVDPHSGRYAFWSNRADKSDTTLTHDFDLSGTTSATLDYWAWWQIEKGYDFAYLEVSTDGGQTWTILHTPSGTDDNTTGANLGWGYTSCSGVDGDPAQSCPAAWVKESVDLSPYAGKKIKVRFEYITDAGLDYPSLLLDDIAVPEISYSCDFEKDACGWQAEGFARVDNFLPQTFSVQVIQISGSQTTVARMPLDASNQGSLPLVLHKGDQAILVVSGTTPFTTESGSYEYEVK
jgi:immune inhibitor A